MGTWDTGPFDNDTAADFADCLDDARPEEREGLIRGVLMRTVDAVGRLTEGEEAVAAAALVASQCPGGESIDTPYGPEQPTPTLPDDLRKLATEAIDRVLDDEDGPGSNWVDPQDGKQWRANLHHLRTVLAPPPATIPMFSVEQLHSEDSSPSLSQQVCRRE
ncbi:DUF4259 domain-containing protein [Streptomyces sp. NPDC048324]|uniref:DUF4259 domain-containing protein n=1 Tax=Streptomyces sp. NPDC048324 TaxID=3157205 RepID=UPI00341DACD1